jgi:hypothetical protein
VTVHLTRFTAGVPIVDDKGRPTPQLVDILNRFVKASEDAINAQPALEAATTAATTAAAAANDAVAQIESGDFDVQALSLNGQRLIWDGSNVVAEP